MDYLTVARRAEERFRRARGVPQAVGVATTPGKGEPGALTAGDTGFADLLARVLALPLDRFAQEGGLVEFRVPWHPDTLWFVPDERHAEILVCEGVKRGRIWTARELLDVMTLPGRTPDVVRTLALAKLTFDADLVEVGRPREGTG